MSVLQIIMNMSIKTADQSRTKKSRPPEREGNNNIHEGNRQKRELNKENAYRTIGSG